MSTLQNHIVRRLTNSFIMGRAIDVNELARDMQRELPGVDPAELAKAIRSVANGIGVRIKGIPHEASLKPLIARVLEIAPECPTNKALRLRLKKEGYSIRAIEATFLGKGLRTQLRSLRTEAPVEL